MDRQNGAESDIPDDDAEVTTRPTGGDPDADGGDSDSTTGSGESGVFVGRTAGQDEGYAGLPEPRRGEPSSPATPTRAEASDP